MTRREAEVGGKALEEKEDRKQDYGWAGSERRMEKKKEREWKQKEGKKI